LEGFLPACLIVSERIAPDKAKETHERRCRRLRKDLPHRITAIGKRNNDLPKEAKGAS
jgi:hypothetical protein